MNSRRAGSTRTSSQYASAPSFCSPDSMKDRESRLLDIKLPHQHNESSSFKITGNQCPFIVRQAGPAPFVPDVVGHHTHTHSRRTQSTRQHTPCPLETAAAGVEGARRCCVLAPAGPIACGVCVCISKKERGLSSSRTTASTILPRNSHIRQEQPYALGAGAK